MVSPCATKNKNKICVRKESKWGMELVDFNSPGTDYLDDFILNSK
jgi:hypothetical protein